jgi:hypothetical protein
MFCFKVVTASADSGRISSDNAIYVNYVIKKNNSVIFHQDITQTFNVDYKVPQFFYHLNFRKWK